MGTPSSNDAAPPIRVRRIDHVTLVVKDLAVSRRFYVDVLGMQPEPRPAFRFDGLWFRAGGTHIHLIAEHEESGPAGERLPPEGTRITRTRHVAFEVDDALAAESRLREGGIAVAAGPQQRPDGPTQIYVQDPDGHLVELYSTGRPQ